MKLTLIKRWLPTLALLSLTVPVVAQTIQVGGPLRPGQGRPPLHINLTPSTATSYSPAQIRHAYGVDKLTATGAGQKLAIVSAYGNAQIQNDLNTFCSQFGIATTTIQVLGRNTGSDAGWAMETALDVEWSHAIAPGAHLILSVAPSSGILDLLNAVDAAITAGATVVSMSWGCNEFTGMSVYGNHFNRTNVTFVASSGDNGAGVEWPAASTFVIAVGGTTLHLDANGNRVSETAWSGSGGGASHINLEPAFQNGWQSSGHRGAPDVSYLADPATGVMVYDSGNGGWGVVGGTSAGAPQWAGLIALANEIRAKSGYATLTSPNNLLYAWAQLGTAAPFAINPAYFFDVSSGNNGGYNAGLKYDFVTGLGSPVASALLPALTPAPKPDFAIAAVAVTNSVKAGKPASYNVTTTVVGGFKDPVKLTASGLPAGVTAAFTPASLATGAGTSKLVLSTTTAVKKGTFTVTVTGTSTGASGTHTHSATVSLTVT